MNCHLFYWEASQTIGWKFLVLVTSQHSRGRNFLGFRNRECPVGRQWLGPGHVSLVLPILFSNQCLTVKPICPPRPSPSRFPSLLTKIDQMSLSAWHLIYPLENTSLFGYQQSSWGVKLSWWEGRSGSWDAEVECWWRKLHQEASSAALCLHRPSHSNRAAPDLLLNSLPLPPLFQN